MGRVNDTAILGLATRWAKSKVCRFILLIRTLKPVVDPRIRGLQNRNLNQSRRRHRVWVLFGISLELSFDAAHGRGCVSMD